MRQDPAKFSAIGRFIGFAILPVALETSCENFYPMAAVAKSEPKLGMRDAVEAVRREWVADT